MAIKQKYEISQIGDSQKKDNNVFTVSYTYDNTIASGTELQNNVK